MNPLSTFYRGFHPRYVWKDNIIGTKSIFMGHHEKSECWMALFLDLLYVGLFTKITHILSTCNLTANFIMFCFSIVLIFYLGRFAIDEYSMRFYQDDIFHRIFYFVYIAGILVMVMNVHLNNADDQTSHRKLNSTDDITGYSVCKISINNYSGLAYGYCITRFAIVGLYSALMVIDKSQKVLQQFGFRCITLVISSIIFLYCDYLIQDTDQKIYLTAIIAAIELMYFFIISIVTWMKINQWIVTDIMNYNFPLNYLEAQERSGTFILLVIGEAVITISEPSWDDSMAMDVYLVNIFGLILVFSFAMQYYDKVQRHGGESHAIRRTMLSGLLFLLMHAIIGFFLLITTQGIINVSESVRQDDHEFNSIGATLLCYGCAFTHLSLIFTRTLHDGFLHRFMQGSRLLHLLVHLGIFACHLGVLYTTLSPRDSVIVQASIALGTIAFDVICHVLKERFLTVDRSSTTEYNVLIPAVTDDETHSNSNMNKEEGEVVQEDLLTKSAMREKEFSNISNNDSSMKMKAILEDGRSRRWTLL